MSESFRTWFFNFLLNNTDICFRIDKRSSGGIFMAKKKRFKYFVDKPFQTKFILNFIVLVVISALISLGYILYVDSQKFSKGILVEKLVKDVYKTTQLYAEANNIKKSIKEMEVKEGEFNYIVSEIDEYLSILKNTEKNIVLAISLRKELVNELSVREGSFLYFLNTAVDKNKVKDQEFFKQNLSGFISKLQSAVYDAKFEGVEDGFVELSRLFENQEDLNKLDAFRVKFLQYRNLVISAYSSLKELPSFVTKVEDIVKGAYSSGINDESIISSISISLSKIKYIVSGIKSPNDVLYFETVAYDGKTYNLLELYWRPILALSLLQIVLITVFGLFFSHRIAGPVHRIKKELRQIAEGELSVDHEIKLRKGDFLLDIAKEINNTLKSISQRYNIK